jgi:NAD(P)-dependent dehydrogenase (short-subunit alcohol dehydrogenase family)
LNRRTKEQKNKAEPGGLLSLHREIMHDLRKKHKPQATSHHLSFTMSHRFHNEMRHPMAHWTTADIPDQEERLAVITGANSGVGYEAAKALAAKGAHVLLAVRSTERGDQAAAQIRRDHPNARLEVMQLDLADLRSVRRFAETFLKSYRSLPLLINNAAVMAIPFQKTADGFEMQFGTNVLGHYMLAGMLLPAVLAAPKARIVSVSSMNHNFGRLRIDNLNGERQYSPWGAYNQTKLANLLLAYELQRRLSRAGAGAISVGCHPGYSATNLQFAGPRQSGSWFMGSFWTLANAVVAQSAAMGALPTLYAATAQGVNGCDYIGPMGLGHVWGYPGKQRSSARSYDPVMGQRLWVECERLTGVSYTL